MFPKLVPVYVGVFNPVQVIVYFVSGDNELHLAILEVTVHVLLLYEHEKVSL